MRGDIEYGTNHKQASKNKPQRPVKQGQGPPVKHDCTQIEGHIEEQDVFAQRIAPLYSFNIVNPVTVSCINQEKKSAQPK